MENFEKENQPELNNSANDENFTAPSENAKTAQADEPSFNSQNPAGVSSCQEGEKNEKNIYDLKYPGPTKYDRAARTYRDALERSQQTGEPVNDRQGMAIASLVLGIFSIIIMLIPVFGWFIGLATSIAGIVLGAISRKSKMRGIAIAGLVTSIVAAAIILILVIFFLSVLIIKLMENSYSYRVPRSYSGSFDFVLPYLR